MTGRVHLVGAGPGDPGLITLRAVECLAEADVVVADRLVAPEILQRHVPPTAELITRAERGSAAAGQPTTVDGQEEINRLLIERARAGQVVVRLKGGDPFVFGRGGEEAEALQQAGIPFTIVPGVTAAVAAPAYAGIPLTHRGLAGAVSFATGHEADDKSAGAIAWSELARAAGTLVLYMSVSRLDEVMQRLIAAGRAPDEPVAVIERGSTARQRTVVGTIADIAERTHAAAIAPPALTIVGEVVRLRERIAWFDRRPLHGRRVLVLATKEPPPRPRSDGAEVVQLSPLAIVPRFAEVKAALGHLDGVQLIALVSAHAVDAFAAALAALGRDARSLHGMKLAAVGAATAERLRALHLHADVVGQSGGAALAAELTAVLPPGRALVLGASDGRPELADALRAAGWQVDAVSAYDAVVDDAAIAAALREHRVRPFSAIAVASPKGARALLEHAGGAAKLGGVLIGAIGETTREALAAAGAPVHLTASRPELAALVDELCARLAAGDKVE